MTSLAAPAAPAGWGPADLPEVPAARVGRFPLRPGEVPQLSAYAASASAVGLRARIVLLSGRGLRPSEVAGALGVSRQTVHTWRTRYADAGLAGLHDRLPASAREVDDAAILAASLAPPPSSAGVSAWSARTLADHLGVGRSTVARAWAAHGVRPNGAGTFRLATSPVLVAQVVDVAGLVLAGDVRLLALLVREAAATGGDRHARTRSVGSGLAPLHLYAATRAALADPAAHARRGHLDLPRWLRSLDAAPRPAGVRLCLLADGPATLARPDLERYQVRPGRPGHPGLDAGGPQRWLDLTAAALTIVESSARGGPTPGCAPELATLLRGLVAGDLVLPAPLVWTAPVGA